MLIRLLVASPDAASRSLFESLLGLALELTPLNVQAAYVEERTQLSARTEQALDDVLVIDWLLVHDETPALVRELLQINPRLRIVVLLPLSYRQYRREVWQAGACSSIARENMEQEWLSSVLCIMHRAMQREARLLEVLAAAGVALPAGATVPAGAAVSTGAAVPSGSATASSEAGCCDESGTIAANELSRKAHEGSPNGKS